MNRLHKTNFTILWICAVVLIATVMVLQGFTVVGRISIIGMLICMAMVTGLYFSHANDVIKGTGMTLIIALGCISVSIMQGGNAGAYIVSFILLGMALYFNEKIIFSYLVIYIPVSLIVFFVNPAYISGPDGDKRTALEFVFSYLMVGIMMYLATKRGSRFIKHSSAMLTQIRQDTERTDSVIQDLNVSMEESSQNMSGLTDQIQSVSDAAYEIETLTKSMNGSIGTLTSLVSDTVAVLNRNVELNDELETQFAQVGEAVSNGGSGVQEVRGTLDTMKGAVLAAGEATDVLLKKISSVSSILKEIQKITMRTNMLSINASIEAAKAGANGKGFAVVAGEIKGLANESSDSAASIQQIIAELEAQVDDVAAKTSAGTQAAVAGMESVERLVSILDEIKSANDMVAEIVTEETQTNTDVSSKFEAVSTEIAGLVSSFESIGGSVESVAMEIHRQNNSVKSVNDEIGKMKVMTNSLNSSADR